MKDFLITCVMVSLLCVGALLAYSAMVGAVIGILIGIGWLMNP